MTYLTPKTAAAQIHASEDRILRLIKAGLLRASNVGAGTQKPRWIIDQADLDTFVGSRANLVTTKATPKRPRQQQDSTPNYL